MVVTVLVLTVLLLGLVALAVALAAATARLLGHAPTGDVALLRRELGRQVEVARAAAAPRLRRLRENATAQR